MLTISLLKKFAPGISFPAITKLSAFSEVPLYFKNPAPAILTLLKLTPGDNVTNPDMAVFGVNADVEIIAAGFDSTSSRMHVYVTLSVPIIDVGVTPVANPSLNSGPINTQPDPENKYSCWLSVSNKAIKLCPA